MSHVQCPKTMNAFAISEKDLWPGCREIEVEGELDFTVSESLRAALARARNDRHHVLVDLSRCEFLDARALAVLIEAHRALDDHGCQLLLCGVRGQVQRLLSLTAVAESGLLATTSAPDVPPTRWSDRVQAVGAARMPTGAAGPVGG